MEDDQIHTVRLQSLRPLHCYRPVSPPMIIPDEGRQEALKFGDYLTYSTFISQHRLQVTPLEDLCGIDAKAE